MFQLTPLPIDIIACIQQAQHPEIGAMELFIGMTRNTKEDNGIHSLYYEAYDEMVKTEAESLETTLKERFPQIRDVIILHRTGSVPVMEPSLLVILTASHRKTLFQAMDECLDLIKKKLPIWKKGIYEDGQEQWLTNQF